MSEKNNRRFTCDLVLLLGETQLGENIANILAENRSITSRGCLLNKVRMGDRRPCACANMYLNVAYVLRVTEDVTVL